MTKDLRASPSLFATFCQQQLKMKGTHYVPSKANSNWVPARDRERDRTDRPLLMSFNGWLAIYQIYRLASSVGERGKV